MPSSTAFDLEGRSFELRHLDIDEACAGLEILAKAIGPALSQAALDGAVSEASMVTALLGQASQVSVLLRKFAPVAKVSRKPDGSFEAGGAMVELKPFLTDVFTGRVDLMIAFLAKAVEFEFGAFLGGAPALAGLLPQTKP